MTARFISIEGADGAGKSTQVRRLVDHLASLGIRVSFTREPGGSEGAEAIRGLLLSTQSGWDMRTEALLFAAARADHVAKRIRPALERGEWVVTDRFVDSSRAYQGVAGGLGDDHVLALHAMGGELMPDRTILLALPHFDSMSRANGEGDAEEVDRILARGAEYQSDVARAFARFAAAEPDRFRLVDASGTIEEVGARVVAALADLLPQPSLQETAA